MKKDGSNLPPVSYHETKAFWKHLLETGLYEDQIHWDWTAKAIVEGKNRHSSAGKSADRKKGKASILAKGPGVWTGDGLVAALDDVFGYTLSTAKNKIENGEAFSKNVVLLNLVGEPQVLLGAERTILNLLSYSCGVAYQTRLWVNAISSAAKRKKLAKIPRLTATRKTLPHYKEIELEAVVLGGGFVHRPHLAGGILIKENHIRLAGGVRSAISLVSAKAPHGLKIEVEVTNLDELNEALNSPAVNGVMLDNFSPKDLRKGLQQKKAHRRNAEIFVEVSGGLSLDTVDDYVEEGVDLLSSGKLTHSVPAVDLSMLW